MKKKIVFSLFIIMVGFARLLCAAEGEANAVFQAAALSERDALQDQVFALKKKLFDRDHEEDRKLEQAAAAFHSRIEELTQQVAMLELTINRKNARIEEQGKVQKELIVEMEKVSGEKMVLREELRNVADQLAGIKTLSENKASDERAVLQDKINDLQSRLTAEQLLTQEKIRQVEQPLRKKLQALAPCEGLLKQKEDQLAAQANGKASRVTELVRERDALLLRERSLEGRNAELLAQVNELRKSIDVLLRVPGMVLTPPRAGRKNEK